MIHHSVKEAKCHRLEIDISTSGYVSVLDSSGMDYLGRTKMYTNDEKLDIQRHSYVCENCGEILQFDQARASI